MNDKIVKEFNDSIASVSKLVESNNAAVSKLFRQQSAFANDLINTNFAYAKTLVDCKDVQAMVEANKAWGQEVADKAVAAGKANIAVMEEVRDAAEPLMAGMIERAQEQVSATVEAAKAKVEETMKAAQVAPVKAGKKAA